MSDNRLDTSHQPPTGAGSIWRKQLRSASPFVVTVCVSVALTLLGQAALPAQQPSGIPPTTVVVPGTVPPLPTATAQPTVQPTVQPTMIAFRMPVGAAAEAQEIAALRQEINRLWSAYYLARAATQLADAEAALRVNDLDEVEQVLTTVDASLDRAYERSAEQEKGPINEFRIQVGQLYENLHVRPEGMDQQLRRLRQSMLSLVDEGS